VSHSLTLVDEVEERVVLDLERIRVLGRLRRGELPAVGYKVKLLSMGDLGPRGTTPQVGASVVSDEEGRFEATVWSPGFHSVSVLDARGAAASFRREMVVAPETEIDIHFAAHDLTGTVVEEGGRPIADAFVALERVSPEGLSTYLSALSDELGRFQLALEASATWGRVHVSKEGYRRPEPVEVSLDAEATRAHLTLRLRRTHQVRGRLMSAAGQPVVGAWIVGYEVRLGESHLIPLGPGTRSGQEGEFFLEGGVAGTRLYLSGPGCPLFAFDAPPQPPPAEGEPSGALILTCPLSAGALALTLEMEDQQPLQHSSVFLKRGPWIYPPEVLAQHLAFLGLPGATGADGRLLLASIEAGEYQVFLGSAANSGTVAAGLTNGYLATARLPAAGLIEQRVTLGLPPDP
jgi:hypothetical protein